MAPPKCGLWIQEHGVDVFEALRVSFWIRQASPPGPLASPALPPAHPALGQALAQERRLLLEAPDILVCTPGRLAEHFLGRGATMAYLRRGSYATGDLFSFWGNTT